MVRCNAPWEGFHVLYGGDVKCCTWSNVVLGNSHTQSIAEIWNGPQFAEIRQRMYDDDLATICPSWCPRLYKDSSKPRLEPGRAETFNGNVARIQAEIALGETQLGSLPIDFRIVPTNACNLRCVMCGQDRGTRRSFGVDFQQDLASFYPYARSILAIGGEPLLARAFVALVRDFDFDLYPDMKFRIVTNGTQFKDSILSLLPGRFDFVGISIDSAIPEKLERIRPGIRWADLSQGIDRVLALPGRDFAVELMFTIMRSNYEELPEFVQFAVARGAVPTFGPVLGDWHGQQFSAEEKQLVLAVLNQLDPAQVPNLEGCKAFYAEPADSSGVDIQPRHPAACVDDMG